MTPQPNTAPALEEALRARVAAKIPAVKVEVFPDDPETYKARNPKGTILVRYIGDDYGPVDDTSETVQERVLLFDLVVVTKSLSGSGGTTDLLEKVRGAVAGFRAPGFRKLYLRRSRFMERGEGVWIYALSVAASTVAAEVPEEETLPALTTVTLTSDYGTTEVQ